MGLRLWSNGSSVVVEVQSVSVERGHSKSASAVEVCRAGGVEDEWCVAEGCGSGRDLTGDQVQFAAGVHDGHGERTARNVRPGPLDVQHVLAYLGRIVVAPDRTVT